jgi:hypothetical protein
MGSEMHRDTSLKGAALATSPSKTSDDHHPIIPYHRSPSRDDSIASTVLSGCDAMKLKREVSGGIKAKDSSESREDDSAATISPRILEN